MGRGAWKAAQSMGSQRVGYELVTEHHHHQLVTDVGWKLEGVWGTRPSGHLDTTCQVKSLLVAQGRPGNLCQQMGFPCGSAGKESACSARDLDSTPGLGIFPGEGKGYPLIYSGLENFMDCIVHGVSKSWTRLRALHFFMGFPCSLVGKESAAQETWVPSLGWGDNLEKGRDTHSSILACKISWTGRALWAAIHGPAKGRARLSD